MTKYLVLRRSPSDKNVWVETARHSAVSSSQAVKKACADGLEPSGAEFVAVPERSFKPVKVTLRTEQRVVLGEETKA